MLKPEDFPTREEALAYANAKLDKWQEKFRELEADMAFMLEGATPDEIKTIGREWHTTAIEMQEAATK